MNFISNHNYFQIFKKRYNIHQLTFHGEQTNTDRNMQNHLFFILNSLFYILILLLYILYYYFIFLFFISKI